VVSELDWDFVSLLLIGLVGFVSVRVYNPENIGHSGRLAKLNLGPVALQLVWVFSEVTLTTPLSKLTALLFHIEEKSLFTRLLPIVAMIGIPAFIQQITSAYRSRSHRQKPALTHDNLEQQKLNHAQDSCRDIMMNDSRESWADTSSPHESCSSDSSGDMSTGLPSPTGFCEDNRGLEKAYLAAMSNPIQDDSIYLIRYDISGEEEYYFVHKKLKPIRTKVEDVRQSNYRPLLRTLIQQSKDTQQHIPAVRNIARANLDGIRMLPCAKVKA
jgi:hypothetical protein